MSVIHRFLVRLGLVAVVPVALVVSLAAGVMGAIVLAVLGTLAVWTWFVKEFLAVWRSA